MIYAIQSQCRACNGPMVSILDLGTPCISNFIIDGEAEPKAPLQLVRCTDCGLVQLRHTVNRDHLYKDTYWYKSGINESMKSALHDLVDDACSRVELLPGDAVLDIGSNDGTMLGFYPDHVKKCGFEPNLHLAVCSLRDYADHVTVEYFPSKAWRPDCQYKVITSIAQFYNVHNPAEYVKQIKEILHHDGVWIIQMQDLDSMLRSHAIDNIVHEHLTYWSPRSLSELLAKHDLYISDDSYNQTNGGSWRVVVKHGTGIIKLDSTGQHEIKDFIRSASVNKLAIVDLLQGIKHRGQTVVGIAASTKANTLLQYYEIESDLLPVIVDRSPEKVGKMTVGSHIPIISEDHLADLKPDYLLALAWHFIDSFKARYDDLGAAWIVPLPRPRILRGDTCQLLTAETSASV